MCRLARRDARRRARRCRGRSSRTTTPPSATASPGSSPASTTSTAACAEPGGFVLPHPPRDELPLPDPDGRAQLTVNHLEVLRVPAGSPAAADRPLARPVQHHHLRPRRPLPRHPPAAGGWCSCTPTTWPSSAWPTATWSTWSASTTGTERRAPRLPGRRLPDRPRLLRRLLPRDQRAGAARQHGRDQQHADLEVDRRPPRTASADGQATGRRSCRSRSARARRRTTSGMVSSKRASGSRPPSGWGKSDENRNRSSPACSISQPTGSVGNGVNHSWRWTYSRRGQRQRQVGLGAAERALGQVEALEPRHHPHGPLLDAPAPQASGWRSSTPSSTIADRKISGRWYMAHVVLGADVLAATEEVGDRPCRCGGRHGRTGRPPPPTCSMNGTCARPACARPRRSRDGSARGRRGAVPTANSTAAAPRSMASSTAADRVCSGEPQGTKPTGSRRWSSAQKSTMARLWAVVPPNTTLGVAVAEELGRRRRWRTRAGGRSPSRSSARLRSVGSKAPSPPQPLLGQQRLLEPGGGLAARPCGARRRRRPGRPARPARRRARQRAEAITDARIGVALEPAGQLHDVAVGVEVGATLRVRHVRPPGCSGSTAARTRDPWDQGLMVGSAKAPVAAGAGGEPRGPVEGLARGQRVRGPARSRGPGRRRGRGPTARRTSGGRCAGRAAGRRPAGGPAPRAAVEGLARLGQPVGQTHAQRPRRPTRPRPVRIRSSAWLWPISRGRRTVPPSTRGTPQRRQ